jgi:iron(III) transport system permease protein
VAGIVLVLVLGLPIIWLTVAALSAPFTAGTGGLGAAMLPTALRETGLLMLWVGVITSVCGLISAYLVSHFEFPLRRMLEWALVLPLAVPTYIAAYCYVEFLAFTGPIQTAIRAVTGATTIRQYWFFDIKTDAGGAFVLSMVLYPYVYTACRAFFLMQSGSIGLASRMLGANGWRTFFVIILPLSRPAMVVGATLAMMEVVNDLGAVQYFGINSLTNIIYTTWINRSNFVGAAQLAVTIVLIIGVLIVVEQWARRNRAYMSHRDSRVPPPAQRLSGWTAAGATLFCLLLVACGFGVPLFELGRLAIRTFTPTTIAITIGAGIPTVLLASVGAVITVVVGLIAAKSGSPGRPAASRGLIRLATLGYAIPGTVLALGLLQPLGQADLWFNRMTMTLFDWRPGLILSGSVIALLYVYAIRFLAVSHSTIDAGMKKRGDTMLDAARVLGVRGLPLLFKIDLPTLLPAILAAATLVFVEIVKELPATLLLRPLGVETLATVVYQNASVARFAEASLPALAIVLVGIVPVIFATRWSSRWR